MKTITNYFLNKQTGHIRLQEQSLPPRSINITLVGAPGCGQTAFCNRFIDDQFSDTTHTVGASISSKRISVPNTELSALIITTDITHRGFGKNVSSFFIKDNNALIYFCYDMTSKESLDWLKEFAKNPEVQNKIEDKKIILIGCKSDLITAETERTISVDEINDFKKEIGANAHYECSAKTGENIENAFMVPINTYFLNKNVEIENAEEDNEEQSSHHCCTIL